MRVGTVAVMVASLAGLAALPANAAVNVAGVDVVASASYSTCNDQVLVTPVSVEPLDGSQSVIARAAVYDIGRAAWIWSDSYAANGINHIFFSVINPDRNWGAYVESFKDGFYAGEYVPITDDLDNLFCAR